MKSRYLLLALGLGSALAIAVTFGRASDAGNVARNAGHDVSRVAIGPAAMAAPAAEAVIMVRGEFETPAEAQGRQPVSQADETPSMPPALPERERAYDALPRTAKGRREAWAAAVEARFNETLGDRGAVERNYALVGQHISARFQDTDMELVLSCSAVLCFIDIIGGMGPHRQFGEAFRHGWPLDGFEHVISVLAPDEDGVSRALMFRDGQYVTMTGEVIDVPEPPGRP